MNLTFIGIGQVGGALASSLLKAGHHVTIAARDAQSDSVRKAQQANPALKALPVQDAAAKATVGRLCADLGWRPVDAGPLSAALHLEHMTLLWIKLGRVRGKGPNFVWAMLER